MSVCRKYIQSQLYMLQKHICFNKYKIKGQISLPVLSPSPSCPQSFLPQPNTPPDTERAKLCSPPAETWTRGSADRDRRCWGELAPSFLFPRPSWPLESWPHVYTWPSEENHHDLWAAEGRLQHYSIQYCSLLTAFPWTDSLNPVHWIAELHFLTAAQVACSCWKVLPLFSALNLSTFLCVFKL